MSDDVNITKNPFIIENEGIKQERHEYEVKDLGEVKFKAVKALAEFVYENNKANYDEYVASVPEGYRPHIFAEYGSNIDTVKLILRELIPEVVAKINTLQEEK